MCIFAACALADNDIWSGIIEKLQSSPNSSEDQENNKNKKDKAIDAKKNNKEAIETSSTGWSLTSAISSFVKHVISLRINDISSLIAIGLELSIISFSILLIIFKKISYFSSHCH